MGLTTLPLPPLLSGNRFLDSAAPSALTTQGDYYTEAEMAAFNAGGKEGGKRRKKKDRQIRTKVCAGGLGLRSRTRVWLWKGSREKKDWKIQPKVCAGGSGLSRTRVRGKQGTENSKRSGPRCAQGV